VNGIDKIWAADFVEMHFHSPTVGSGIFSQCFSKCVFSCFDVFSKYGWMLPLKTGKLEKSVADAFKEIFKKSKRKPDKLWTDKGREFYNKHVNELGVELYSTENEEKSSVVERWNRTMKEKMLKYSHSKQYQQIY